MKGNRQGFLSRSITRRSGQNCKIILHFIFCNFVGSLSKKVQSDFFDKLSRRPSGLRLDDLLKRLFDFQTARGCLCGNQLRKRQLQDAVFIGGADLIDVNAVQIEAAAVAAEGTLAAQEAVLLVLLLIVGMTLRADDQAVVVNVDLDVLFVKAGQICREDQVVALVFNVGAEGSQRVRREDAALNSSSSRKGL